MTRFVPCLVAVALAVACSAKNTHIASIPEMPTAPQPEFISKFAPTLPDGASDTRGWGFVQFAAHYDIQQPRPSKPLDGYAIRTGFCEVLQPCRFRMFVLTLQKSIEPIATPAVMRYVLVRSDGLRLEGYAQSSRTDLSFAYYRFDGHVWALLRDADALAEHEFVHATWNYVAMQ